MTTPWFHILSGLSGLDSTQLLRYPQNPIPLKIPLYPNCFGTTCRRWGNTGCLTKAELRLCCIQVLGGLSFPGGKQRKWPFGHPQGHGSFLLNCILSFCFILEKEKKNHNTEICLKLNPPLLPSPAQCRWGDGERTERQTWAGHPGHAERKGESTRKHVLSQNGDSDGPALTHPMDLSLNTYLFRCTSS